MVLERSLHNDTLTYWITDTTVAYKDTLTFSLTYLDTDTLGQLAYRTDTLDLIPKITHARQAKERQKKIEEWEDQQKKAKRRQKGKVMSPSQPIPTRRPHLLNSSRAAVSLLPKTSSSHLPNLLPE